MNTVSKIRPANAGGMYGGEPSLDQDVSYRFRRGLPLVVSLERRRLQLYFAQMLVDASVIVASFWIVATIYLAGEGFGRSLNSGELILPLFWTVAAYNGTYSTSSLTTFRLAVVRSLGALFLSVSLLLFVLFLSKSTSDFSRLAFSGGVVLSGVALVAVRWMATRWVTSRWGPNPTNVLIIHDGGPSIYKPHAYHVCAAEHGLQPSLDDPHALNTIGRYFINMDRVIISCPLERRGTWAKLLRSAGVRGEVTSDALHELGALSLHKEDDFTSLVIATGPLGLRSRVLKRAMDIVIAGVLLACAAPVMLAVAIAIRIEDGGPIFFNQHRLGRGNCFFLMHKFRSMSVAQSDKRGARSTSRNDQRVTRVGSFIRKTSLDELPQLFNVLKGEMSLVGPRPHALGSQVDDRLFWEVESRYWNRHSLKPGVTGLAQVMGFRGATEAEIDLTERVRFDLIYIQKWSPWLDLWILVRTLKVLVHENAY